MHGNSQQCKKKWIKLPTVRADIDTSPHSLWSKTCKLGSLTDVENLMYGVNGFFGGFGDSGLGGTSCVWAVA